MSLIVTLTNMMYFVIIQIPGYATSACLLPPPVRGAVPGAGVCGCEPLGGGEETPHIPTQGGSRGYTSSPGRTGHNNLLFRQPE